MRTRTPLGPALLLGMSCALVLTTSFAQTMPSSPQAPVAPAAPGIPYLSDMRSMHDVHGQQHRRRMMHQHRVDPVSALTMRLDRLGNDLHLKAEQQAAWEALRNHLISRAQQAAEQMKAKRAAMMQSVPGHAAARSAPESPGLIQQNLNPDEALVQRAQRLRDQANQLDQTALLVKALHEKLSPEQRTIMRLHRERQPARIRAWQAMKHGAPAMPGFGPADAMRRGAISDDDSQAIGGLEQTQAMMAMLEAFQGFDQADALDEALSLIR
ncbi:MAG: hypothetical protein KGO85_02295 [Proteobacteria bacterium]|jgi:hypothetical protein|nr:hypothetical protein [Pseudomonadota bacterium]